MRRLSIMLGSFVVAAVLAWVYFSTRLPSGVDVKAGGQDWTPWITLAGAIVSFLTGLTSLVLKIVEVRSKTPKSRTKRR